MHIYIFFVVLALVIIVVIYREFSFERIKEKTIVTMNIFKQYIITTLDEIPINDPIIKVFFSKYKVDRIDDNKKLASNINKLTNKEKIYEMVTEYVNDTRTKMLELLKNYNKKDIVIDINKRSDDLIILFGINKYLSV